MEVKQKRVAALSNCEVLSLSNEMKSSSLHNINSGSQLATITYEVSQYLQNANNGQTENDVKNLLTALQEFSVPLTFNEKLMIVNNPPKTALELSLIIRNYDERLKEEEVELLLGLIVAHSP